MFSFLSRPVLKSLSFTTGRGFAKNLVASSHGEKLARKLGELDAIVKSTGRVPTRDFLAGLTEMMQPGAEVTPIQGLIMLRCCGSLLQEETIDRRNELAEQTWLTLIDRGVKLDISHYNALLRIYLENSKQFDPLQFLEDLEAKKIQPNRVTYQRIIHHFCSSGQMEIVAKLLVMLKEKNVPLTDTIFNSLLVGYIKAGDLNGFHATLKLMSQVQLELTDETYTIVLSAAAEMSEKDARCLELFNDTCKELQIKNVCLSNQQKLEVATRVPESFTQLFDDFIATCGRDSEYNTDCYNAVLELVNMKKIDHALKLLRTMNRSNSPLFQSGHFMIRQMVKTGVEPEKVMMVCDQLKKDGLTSYALNVAVEASFDHCNLQTCRVYFKKFIEECDGNVGRPHYYWPLLTKCTSDAQVLDIVLSDMATMDKLCPARSILDTFEEYVWTRNIRDPLLLLEQIKPAGYPSSLILTSLVNHYVQNHRLKEALNVLNKNSHIFVHPRFVAPNLAISFAKKGEVSEFVALVRKLRSMTSEAQDESWISNCLLLYMSSGGHNRIPIQKVLSEMKGMRIPAAVLDTIKERDFLKEEDIQMLSDCEAFSYSKTRNGEARGDIEALENHLIELKSRGMDTRGCQRKLILAYCKKPVNEKSNLIWNRVEELVKDLESQQFTFTPALNASLMDFYANHGEVERALEMRRKIPSEFAIDPFKIIDLATALIRKGKCDQAMDLIQEQLQIERQEREEGTSTDRNVFKILNAAAEETRDPKIVSRLLGMVLPLVNVKKPTNVMMGPMIKVHLLNDNLKGALDEFAHAASAYGVTPWRGELMRKVIEMDDPVSLQLLTDITVKIYGEPVALVDVAVAFISAGKLPQAKKVMSHPSFSLASRAIANATERFISKNEIELLEKFVDTMSQSSAKIDKEPIYFQLIRGYASRNDPQKALDVWTTMQEKEIIPSAKTLRYLGSFLKESGLEVPFDYTQVEGTSAIKEKGKATTKGGKKEADLVSYCSQVEGADVDELIQKRRKLRSEGCSIPLSVEGGLIVRLINSNKSEEAIKILTELINEGSYPTPRVLRQVISVLNRNGDVKTMESIQDKLPEQFKNQSWYTNQLAYCFLNAKQEEKFVSEILPTLKPCPLSALLSLLQSRPEFETKILEIADKALKEENFVLIHNIIWSHRMISHRFEDARDLFRSIPQMKDALLFQTLINRVRLERDLELADALASLIEETNLMGRKLAEVHSAKIDALVELDRAEEAEDHLMNVLQGAKTRTSKVKIEDLKRMTLVRLRQKLIEVCNREPKFDIPQKTKIEEEDSQQQRMADTL